MSKATQRYKYEPMRLSRSVETAFGKVGTFWESKNLQFSEGGFANPPRMEIRPIAVGIQLGRVRRFRKCDST
jgi:hypothetical protein